MLIGNIKKDMKKPIIYHFIVIFLLLTTGLASCTKEGPFTHYENNNKFNGTIYDFLRSQPDHFNYLLFVLDKAGLTDMLKQEDSLTFFVPTDVSLLAALNEYNVYRQSNGLSKVALNDIDSSSWRYILLPYIAKGIYTLEDFSGQDGLDVTTMAMRLMHGDLIRHNASGAKNLGSKTIQFSYPNGSKYVKDWISTNISTPNIRVKNGIIYVVENRHVLGFSYFSGKASEPQNLYSEARAFASGQMTDPDGTLHLWSFYNKKLTAVNSNTIEVEAVSNAYGGLGMWLTIHPDDSITIRPAPWSGNQNIHNTGPCYFDSENLQFILNYGFQDILGEHVINETIRYIAIRTK